MANLVTFHPVEVFRPVFWFFAAGTYAFFGLEPTAYHVAGLGLHVVNSALLGLLSVLL